MPGMPPSAVPDVVEKPPPTRYGTNYVPTYTNFLDLPAEVRVMVYKYALIARPISKKPVTDDFDVPMEPNNWPADSKLHYWNDRIYRTHQKVQRPAAMFLATCRTVNEEAKPILYGMNTFRLPDATKLSKLSETGFLKTSMDRFRSIVIDLQPLRLIAGNPDNCMYDIMAALPVGLLRPTPNETIIPAMQAWRQTREVLRRMTELEDVHVKIKEIDERPWVIMPVQPSGDLLRDIAEYVEPFLQAWAEFMFGEDPQLPRTTESRKRPRISAHFERKMNDEDKALLARIWTGPLIHFHHFRTGCWA